jgi:antitoxin (DNA-binding transcriptional repressor) of toxin-antitoxin stability system
MDVTARQLEQQIAQVLARVQAGVQAGETVTVTRNGQPLNVVRPCRDDAPTFRGVSDFSERVDDLLAGFGADG